MKKLDDALLLYGKIKRAKPIVVTGVFNKQFKSIRHNVYCHPELSPVGQGMCMMMALHDGADCVSIDKNIYFSVDWYIESFAHDKHFMELFTNALNHVMEQLSREYSL